MPCMLNALLLRPRLVHTSICLGYVLVEVIRPTTSVSHVQRRRALSENVPSDKKPSCDERPSMGECTHRPSIATVTRFTAVHPTCSVGASLPPFQQNSCLRLHPRLPADSNAMRQDLFTQDHYRVLGVAPDASHDQIRAAYLKLVKQHHPDVSKGAQSAERFKAIASAWEVGWGLPSMARLRSFQICCAYYCCSEGFLLVEPPSIYKY